MLEQLIAANLGWLHAWFRARLRGPRQQEADDLCQETLLRVVRGAARLEDAEKFPAWLYRIANNVLRDHLRRRKAAGRFQGRLEVEPADPRDIDAQHEADEDLERTVEALLELPKKYREPMLLRHVEDLSYARIAQILGLSENAVQVRIFRARKALRERLKTPSGVPARAGRTRGRET